MTRCTENAVGRRLNFEMREYRSKSDPYGDCYCPKRLAIFDKKKNSGEMYGSFTDTGNLSGAMLLYYWIIDPILAFDMRSSERVNKIICRTINTILKFLSKHLMRSFFLC